MNLLSYVDCSKLCMVTKYFLQLNQKIGKEDITFTLSSSSRATEWRKIILMNLNQGFIKGIQERTMTSQLIKKFFGDCIFTRGK